MRESEKRQTTRLFFGASAGGSATAAVGLGVGDSTGRQAGPTKNPTRARRAGDRRRLAEGIGGQKAMFSEQTQDLPRLEKRSVGICCESSLLLAGAKICPQSRAFPTLTFSNTLWLIPKKPQSLPVPPGF
jgi:hypothetical protein